MYLVESKEQTCSLAIYLIKPVVPHNFCLITNLPARFGELVGRKEEKCESAESDRKDDEEKRLEGVSNERLQEPSVFDIKCNRREM